jgi:hypothetical protein
MFDPANPAGTVARINSQLAPNTGTAQFPVSFGEDAVGNLYIAYIGSGEVFRINTNAFTPGDFDGDADVDGDDLTIWSAGFGMASGAARANGDANGDAAVDGADYLLWQQNLGWSALNVGSLATSGAEREGVASWSRRSNGRCLSSAMNCTLLKRCHSVVRRKILPATSNGWALSQSAGRRGTIAN